MTHNVVLLILRVFLGAMIFAHGYNKIFRGGKLKGTAGWFESIGMKPGMANAVMAAATEVGCGVLLIVGLLNPLAAGALVALMCVAIVTVHRFNGFFVFNKGQGVEYCAAVIVAALTSGAFGAGRYSLDHLLRHQSLEKWLARPTHALVITALAGFGGAGLQLVALYRPNATKKQEPSHS
jgi:putative oxidoreductase